MRFTPDDEIDRAVCSTTPTASAAPAPKVLREMRAAIRAEHRQQLWRRLSRAAAAGSVVVSYVALALSIAALVTR